MSNQINRNNYNLNDAIIRQSQQIKTTNSGNEVKNNAGDSFQSILKRQLQNLETNREVSFSKHANQRTEERNIQISQTDMSRLGEACDKAEKKGIKDALVMMNDSAFIVNAQNRVVITVMDSAELKDNVFTNIDGAVFV